MTLTFYFQLSRKMLGYSTEESDTSLQGSDKEYVPQSADEAEDDDSETEVRQQHAERKVSNEEDAQPRKRRWKTRSTSLAVTDTTESSSPDSTDVSVMKLKKKEYSCRLYNKKYYCIFCSQPFSKIARHLESKHKNEPEVERALQFPKGSKERRLQINLLRNRGNRVHNNQVLKEGKGQLIPCQQSSGPVKASDYMHCINHLTLSRSIASLFSCLLRLLTSVGLLFSPQLFFVPQITSLKWRVVCNLYCVQDLSSNLVLGVFLTGVSTEGMPVVEDSNTGEAHEGW